MMQHPAQLSKFKTVNYASELLFLHVLRHPIHYETQTTYKKLFLWKCNKDGLVALLGLKGGISEKACSMQKE
jgi:hypothetical protein